MSHSSSISPIAVVYPALAGVGGLGLQSVTAIAAIARLGKTIAIGPGLADEWVLDTPVPTNIEWRNVPPFRPSCLLREIVQRLSMGRFSQKYDAYNAHWAAQRVAEIKPSAVYSFTQVGLETLEWAVANKIPTALDNPNGHIRNFAEVCRREWAKWIGGRFSGHPSKLTIARVEREYELADRIRVSSQWAKATMVSRGVPAGKISVIPQPINIERFKPPQRRDAPEGPLRICYVGSLDLRKGFVYLLRAMKAAGPSRVQLEIVGGTGDRGTRWLLTRELQGLDVRIRAGDPRPTYHNAEIFVLPSLEDGFGFVAAEAMACGLPVVVTDQCGAAEWVRDQETGWVIPAGDVEALAAILERACADRHVLVEMGKRARIAMEARSSEKSFRQLAEWFERRTDF